MKRSLKQVLALVLAVVMVIGVCPIASFAGAAPELKYVSLGDSMTNGYGLDGYLTSDGKQVNGFRQVAEDAYPYQFAEWLAVKNGIDMDEIELQQLAISCTRAADVNFALRYDGVSDPATLDYCDQATMEEFVNGRYNDWKNAGNGDAGDYLWNSNPTQAYTNFMQDRVADADIVSMAVGNSDFGVFMLRRLCATLGMPDYGDVDDYIQTANIYNAGTPAMQAAAASAQNTVKALLIGQGIESDMADKLSRVVLYTAENFMVRYDQAIQAIVELNPDVELILVGLMNNMNGVKIAAPVLGDDKVLDMGQIMGACIGVMNAYLAGLPVLLQELGEYPDATIYFAPCNNVEVFQAEFAAHNTANFPVVRARVIRDLFNTLFSAGMEYDDADAFAALVADYESKIAAVRAAGTDATLLVSALEDFEAWIYANLSSYNDVFLYCGLEKAMENAASMDVLDGGTILTVPEALADPSSLAIPRDADVIGAIGTLTDVYVYSAVHAAHIGAIGLSNEYAPAWDNVVMQALYMPDAIASLITPDSDLYTLLNLFGRFVAGDGIGSHPDAAGHDAITASMINVYGNHITAKDYVTAEAEAIADALYQLALEHGPEALEAAAYFGAKAAGLTDAQIATIVNEAQAAYNAYVNKDMEAVKANVNAIAAYIEATYPEEVAAVKAAVLEAKTAFEQAVAKYNELVEAIESGDAEAAVQAAVDELMNQLTELEAYGLGMLEAAEDYITEKLDEYLPIAEAQIAELKQCIDEQIEALKQCATEKVEEIKAQVEPVVEQIKELLEDACAEAEELRDELSSLNVDEIREELIAALEALVDDLSGEAQAKAAEGVAHVEEKLAELTEMTFAELEDLLNECLGEYLDNEDIEGFVDTLRNASIDTIAQDLYDYHETLKEKYAYVIEDTMHDEYALIKDENYYVALGSNTVAATDSYFKLLSEALGAELEDGYVINGKNLGVAGLQPADVLAYIAENADEITKADLITYQMDAGTFIQTILSDEDPDWSDFLTEEQIAAINEALPVVEQILADDWTNYVNMSAEEIIDALKNPVMNCLSQKAQQLFEENEALLDALLVAALDAVKTAVSELQAQLAELAQQVDAFVQDAFVKAFEIISDDYVTYADKAIEDAAAMLADQLAAVLPTADELTAMTQDQLNELVDLCAEAAVFVHEYLKNAAAETAESLTDEQLLAFNLVFPVAAQIYLDHWADLVITGADVAAFHNDVMTAVETAIAGIESPIDPEAATLDFIDKAVELSEQIVNDAITNAQNAALDALTLVKGEYDEIANTVASVLAEDWAEYVGENAETIAEKICEKVAEKLAEGSEAAAALVDAASDKLAAAIAPIVEKVQEIVGAAQAQKEDILAKKDAVNSILNYLGTDVETILNNAVYAAVAYVVNTNKAIDAIRELNADAPLLVVGMYNPLQGLAVSYDGNTYDVGAYLDCLVDATNFYYSALAFADCLKTENYVTFVPVTNTSIQLQPTTINVDSSATGTALMLMLNQISGFYLALEDENSTLMVADADGQAYIRKCIFDTLDSEDDALIVTIPVTDVTVTPTTLNLVVGGSAQITATVEPATAQNKNIIWTSSDPSVATVDASGNVTAVGAGTAIITATTEDGELVATCTVTVSNPAPAPIDPTPVKDLRFIDVMDPTAFYYDPVYWAVKKGITEGITDTIFGPEMGCTRAHMVTFLWRASGCPEPTTTECPYTDVDLNDYYGKALLWAIENHITRGTSETTFSPDLIVTRAQAVTFMARMCGVQDEDIVGGNKFVDVTSADYYNNAVTWAANNGITNGVTDTTYAPNDDCLRGQIVTFLYRLFGK